jgi:hypothetical protein
MPSMGSMVTRDELYALVWAEPMLRIAERYGVSSSYLARVCSNLKIPRPARGYWAKLAVGKAPKKPELPPALPGDEISWTPGTLTALVKRKATTPGRKVRGEKKSRGQPNGDDGEHLLIRDARPHFNGAGHKSRNGYLKPSKRNLLDIVVTEPLLASALDLANGLFLALERRGHRVVLGSSNEQIFRPTLDPRDSPNKQPYNDNLWSPGRGTLVYVRGTPVGIIVYELTEATLMHYMAGQYIRDSDFKLLKKLSGGQTTWTSTQDIPSGRLGIVVYASCYDRQWMQCWKEPKASLFEKSVLSLARKIESVQPEAEATLNEGRARYEQSKIDWEVSRKKRAAEELERKRQKAIVESREDLMRIVLAFERADQTEKALSRLNKAAENLNESEKSRFSALLAEAKLLLGPEPTIQSFLAWKTPSERS